MSEEGKSLFNEERLNELLSIYKFPLIFAVTGIILFTASISMLVKNQKGGEKVIFTTGEASGSASRRIYIDVEGAVMTPGVYEFREGGRISDALVKAGGLSVKADRDWINKNINKAAKLVDGGKVYIPSVNEFTEGKNPNDKIQMSNQIQNPNDRNSNLLGVSIGKVNINTVSQKELEDLPGVGPVTAGKIISGRPYQTIEELKSKKAVGNALFEKIKDQIVI